jgi:hypothetical protein
MSFKSNYFSVNFSFVRKQTVQFHTILRRGKFNLKTAAIHPASPICSYVSFYLFLTAVSCGLTSYEIAFSTDSEKETNTLLAMRVILEVFFWGRIFGNFHLAFPDQNGVLVTNVGVISRRFRFNWKIFFADDLFVLLMINFLCEFKIRYESIWTGNGPFDNLPYLLTRIFQCRREEQNGSRCQRASVISNGNPNPI